MSKFQLEERILTEKRVEFYEDGDPIFRQFIEWKRDGKVIRRGHRMIYENGRLYKQVELKYEQAPA